MLLAASCAAAAAESPTFLSRTVERGQDFAVIQNVTSRRDAEGAERFRTNEFTLVHNNLHYFEAGEWKESEDLIEPFPNGAIARRGPDKAIFSNDLNAEAVFDIATADGHRLQGGLRALQLTDTATGASVLLGTVREHAPGRLLPPNRIVYVDCIEGLQADLLLEWRHNAFVHDVLLRERPARPAWGDMDTTGDSSLRIHI